MKKILILSLLFFASCTQRRIEVIDGCQYIVTNTISGEHTTETLAHKGDCTNPIHIYAKPAVKQDTFILPLKSGPLVFDSLKK